MSNTGHGLEDKLGKGIHLLKKWRASIQTLLPGKKINKVNFFLQNGLPIPVEDV
ncbi:hypothetical protein [Desmospora profundinema]|uniref:Uncharacterized protein n=1 Tax=Desmospora profundinema TaxID=1571184 RepID=A0ABU1IMJ8_9BACL|nr:hypothetical protein [Desmospora profundinema]MDR6226007.1 hypothetical protein [Desmospora profundinema]